MNLGSIRKKATSLIKGNPSHTATIRNSSDLVEMAHWIEPQHLRLLVPASMLRMQGAYIYDFTHPWVKALKTGEQALQEFYSIGRPDNIAQYYGVKNTQQLGADLPAWEIPWYQRKHRTPPPGEAGLAPKHGVSFYGPATPEKIIAEMKRLNKVTISIQKHGYDPDAHGDIEGYILRDKDKACFFVRGGKHRAAALSYLEYEYIPVAFRANLPRIIDKSQVSFWPLVSQKLIDPNLATDIFDTYTRSA